MLSYRWLGRENVSPLKTGPELEPEFRASLVRSTTTALPASAATALSLEGIYIRMTDLWASISLSFEARVSESLLLSRPPSASTPSTVCVSQFLSLSSYRRTSRWVTESA